MSLKSKNMKHVICLLVMIQFICMLVLYLPINSFSYSFVGNEVKQHINDTNNTIHKSTKQNNGISFNALPDNADIDITNHTNQSEYENDYKSITNNVETNLNGLYHQKHANNGSKKYLTVQKEESIQTKDIINNNSTLHRHTTYNKNMELLVSAKHNIRYTKKDLVLKIYQMLYDTNRILIRHNIPYWIIAGTLLGAVRHKGLIPWDNDIDIYVHKKYRKLFTFRNPKIKSDFHKLGYDINPWRFFGFKVFCINSTDKNFEGLRIPFLDIMIVQFDEFNKTKLQTEGANIVWKNEWFFREEIYPLKEYKFGNLKVFGPNKPFPYLQRAYGLNWNQTRWKSKFATKKVEIPIDKYQRMAAKPFGPIQTNKTF
eukprot:440004_1